MRAAAKDEGRTVLYVSHNMNTIRELCDSCVVLNHGKVIYDGEVERGIELYTCTTDNFKTHYEYSAERRSKWARGQVTVRGITFENSFSGQCYSSDEVKLILSGEAKADLKHVRFHFEVEASNGTIIGTMFADKEIAAKEGDKFEVPMSLNLSGMAPGRYSFNVVAETLESFESYEWQDTVFRAFVLEIIEDPTIQRMSVWNTKTWGHVRLQDVNVKVGE